MLKHVPGRFRGDITDRLQRPLRDLRVSLTDACNYRCPYCMPADQIPDDFGVLPADKRLSFEEIERVVRAFVRAGVSKVRLTGGEPLLRKNLPRLIEKLSAIEGVDDLALTTNGQLLSRFAHSLASAGLSRITVSLDAMTESVFRQTTGGRGELDAVLRGISAATEAGLGPVKINAVLVRGLNEQELLPLARFGREQSLTVRYIEYMDVGNINGWEADRVIPSSKVYDELNANWPLKPLKPNYRGEVAERYLYEDGAGEVGLISSVSKPFCGDCNRARLSADGHWYTCLFSSEGLDLRPLLTESNTEERLYELIRNHWRQREDRYSEARAVNQQSKDQRKRIEMFYIGG